MMNIRAARVSDVDAIHALISDSAEQDRMLFRAKSDIFENIQAFVVADDGQGVPGCCALEVIWSDLSEVKSLAVDATCRGKGGGRALVEAVVAMAVQLGVSRVFALTLEPVFFTKMGFDLVDRSTLPMKVWRDCARCPKQQHCDEIAMIMDVGGAV
ncbi:MAG: N-acetyltransferase [Planctomycetes bacterium]|nr:N-acetyltransferase [Planctomycetota bacterium]